MAFLLFVVEDNYRAVCPLPTEKAEPRPCCSSCALTTEISGARSSYSLGLYQIVVSSSYSERLAIGWWAEALRGKLLDQLFGDI